MSGILPFTVFWMPTGDIACMDGSVIDMASGTVYPVGFGTMAGAVIGDYLAAGQMPMAMGSTFLGGSGRNLIATGFPDVVSGLQAPNGFWTPGRDDEWISGDFKVAITGVSTAEITDGTDIVANWSSGSFPAGTYTATTYGETTYNAGNPFDITIAAEGTGDAFGVTATPNATGPTALNMTATSNVTWTDSGWTLTVNSDGTADIDDGTDTVATREAAGNFDPAGAYASTTYGATTYTSGDPFAYFVNPVRRAPNEGFIYLHLTLSSGLLTGADGPFFESYLPTPDADNYYVPIARITSTGAVEQFHAGALLFR